LEPSIVRARELVALIELHRLVLLAGLFARLSASSGINVSSTLPVKRTYLVEICTRGGFRKRSFASAIHLALPLSGRFYPHLCKCTVAVVVHRVVRNHRPGRLYNFARLFASSLAAPVHCSGFFLTLVILHPLVSRAANSASPTQHVKTKRILI